MHLWPQFTLALAALPLEHTFTTEKLEYLGNRTRALFNHGFDSYVAHALPFDELRPLTCTGVGADPDELHFGRNDAMGNFSLTLIDTLDTLAILGDQERFEWYVNSLVNLSFDVPSVVSVFETNIRVIGGLLSAHLYASVPRLGHAIPGYNGHLLAKAYDLAERLLAAFSSPTGIPYPRVNLQKGVVPIGGRYWTETSAAGAGTLVLEWGLLSRLTDDPRFERAAKRAFWQVWARRSPLNLLGMGLDCVSGKWIEPFGTVAASSDSWYEYALKYGLLFNDSSFMKVWEEAFEALQKHSTTGWFYTVVNMFTGNIFVGWIDALGAFFGSVQVLSGHILEAVKLHITYFKLWNQYGGLPERWTALGLRSGIVELEWYLLRPEFIETTYYLYQATRDPFYLHVGEAILSDIENWNVVECGVAATQDVRTGLLADRQDSFFLGETLKYLYLLFASKHPINQDDRVIFSTEAHPFWYDPDIVAEAGVHKYSSAIVVHSPSIFRWFWRGMQASTPKLPKGKQKDTMCPVWGQPLFGSGVASWNHFYDLDAFYNFTKPSWLPRQNDIEFENDFNYRYVTNYATCAAPF